MPDKHAIYRFEKRLVRYLPLLEEMFPALVGKLRVLLPGFGTRLATDSTKIHSQGSGRKPSVDEDASWKKYVHIYTGEDGKPKKASVKWFGYKLHLIVDAIYELPMAALISTAKDNDAPHFPALWQKAKETVAGLEKIALSNTLDKGYDEEPVHTILWNDRVEPVIPVRNLTQEENKVLLAENQRVCPNALPLRFDGLERSRNALRYDLPKTCPKVGGETYCEMADSCAQKLVRFKLDENNLRHVGPVPQDSKKFRRIYNGRTAVERVNARLKAHDGLDQMRRRGINRVSAWAMLSLLCMNAFAVAMAEAGRTKDIRRTVYSVDT